MKKVIVFKASWCVPCKHYAPIVESATDKIKAKGYELEVLDVEENINLAETYKIKAVPTTIILDGDKVKTLQGLKTEEELLSNL